MKPSSETGRGAGRLLLSEGGLAYDPAYLADFLQTISGPIVLVGHSYGGAVITNAATGDKQVKALVYVDAFLSMISNPGAVTRVILEAVHTAG